jgi:hypothetical protein
VVEGDDLIRISENEIKHDGRSHHIDSSKNRETPMGDAMKSLPDTYQNRRANGGILDTYQEHRGGSMDNESSGHIMKRVSETSLTKRRTRI